MVNRTLVICDTYANSSERNGKPDGELVKMIKYERGEKHPKCDPQSIRKVLAENKGFDFPGLLHVNQKIVKANLAVHKTKIPFLIDLRMPKGYFSNLLKLQ
jgi:hypothetical protein